MNNLNKSLCGGDGFSHAYIVVHWYFGCINILVQNQKCKKCWNKFSWTTWFIMFLHDYFLHMWFALGATNFLPNECKQSNGQMA